MKDPDGVEYVASPELQIKRAVNEHLHSGAFALWGDCDEGATLAGSLMLYFGQPSALVAIRQAGNAEFSHVFLRWAGGDVDPTVPASLLPLTDYEEALELPL